jgi:ABC-type sugar transport system ATPase subunit
MSTALRCTGLGHRYGRHHWGLRDCDLDVPAGRVAALVGPNGSGKTTLMSMAAGLLPATAGTVEAAGGDPARRLDRIGFVAQDAPLWPRLRVADVLAVGRCMNRGVCDYLIVLRAGQVRLAGDIDELRQRHPVIRGPDGWPDGGGWQVISQRSAAGQTTALVRRTDACLAGPGLRQETPTFDELVLGYLDGEGARPPAKALA